MWKRHWKLTRDPFLDAATPYVPTPQHEEAVARLVDAVATGQRTAHLRAASGLGKSRVLTRVLAESRSPSRRIARVSSPADGESLFAGLAEGLGVRNRFGTGRGAAWKALSDAVRLCRWQRLQVVLAVDDCQDLAAAHDRLDLERLAHLDLHPSARLTVIAVDRPNDVGEPPPPQWGLAIRIAPLSRAEAEDYLAAKLAAAGRPAPTYTPRAVHRLHSYSGGVPRGLDRLASLALMAGALRGLEIIPPDVIDGVAHECHVMPATV